ncbi:uncharacterized protein [Triticum aestivum]|uniref:uncharacterized protein n=1 Tax=Triticum aestivum TaxID=4565 RepID=UPI001D0031E5|nr:uncharacterized protein LOC123138467 [Triticum aestivum]
MAAIDFCCYARPTSSPVVASEPSPIPTPPIPATHGERAAPLPASPAAPRTPRGGWRCWERWGARAMTRIGSCWTSGGRAATCRKVDKSCGGAASGCWNRQDPVLLPAASRAGTGDPRSYYRLHLGECKLRAGRWRQAGDGDAGDVATCKHGGHTLEPAYIGAVAMASGRSRGERGGMCGWRARVAAVVARVAGKHGKPRASAVSRPACVQSGMCAAPFSPFFNPMFDFSGANSFIVRLQIVVSDVRAATGPNLGRRTRAYHCSIF